MFDLSDMDCASGPSLIDDHLPVVNMVYSSGRRTIY